VVSRAVGTHCSCLRRQRASATAAKIVAQLAPHISRSPRFFRAKIGPKFFDLYASIYGTLVYITLLVRV